MMIVFLLIVLCLSEYSSAQQLPFTRLSGSDIPRYAVPDSALKAAYEWVDHNGRHLTLISETGATPHVGSEENDSRDARLRVNDYLYDNALPKLLWTIADSIIDCPVEISCATIDSTFEVTDLDNNGIGEVWIMYKNSCYGDVSPISMSLVMYQGQAKHVMSGTTRVRPSRVEVSGGEYRFDSNFLSLPRVFRERAKKKWRAHVTERWR
jgi:hypothetical protein